MTTDKYGPIDFEDQFFQAFQQGVTYSLTAEDFNVWDMWVAYCNWLEDWVTEDEDA